MARASLGPGFDGILVVAKPPGPTSHDVVALVRRLAATKRVGHGGTLDPFAAGVLPVFLGKATRVVEFHLGDRKEYRTTVCFGASSSTDDLEGELMGPIITQGRQAPGMPSMPPIALPADDVRAVAAYIHSVQATMRGQGSPPPGTEVQPDMPFEYRRMLDDPFVLVAPTGSPLATRTSIALDEVTALPLIGYRDAVCSTFVEQIFRPGAPPRFVSRPDDTPTTQGCGASGIGYGATPLLTVDPDDPAVAVVPPEPAPDSRHIALAWPTTRRSSAAVPDFVAGAEDVCRAGEQRPTAGLAAATAGPPPPGPPRGALHPPPAPPHERPKIGSVFVPNSPPFGAWSPENLPDVYAALEAPPRPGTPLGLYLHIPFCRKRCKFCYFKVFTDKHADQIERYLAALSREIELISRVPAMGGRPFRFVLSRGGWYRPGGVVRADGVRVAASLEAWAEAELAGRDGDMEIYSMAADGSDPRRLTRRDGKDTMPTISPDPISSVTPLSFRPRERPFARKSGGPPPPTRANMRPASVSIHRDSKPG